MLNIYSALAHADHVATTVAAHTTQTAEAAAAGAGADAGPSDSQLATLTKAYFDKVNAYIERIRKYKAQSTGFRANGTKLMLDELPKSQLFTSIVTWWTMAPVWLPCYEATPVPFAPQTYSLGNSKPLNPPIRFGGRRWQGPRRHAHLEVWWWLRARNRWWIWRWLLRLLRIRDRIRRPIREEWR